MIVSHFQVVALLCRTVTEMVSDTLKEFSNTYIIINKVLSHNIFNAQIKAIVEQLKSTKIANIPHTNDFL
ncbi:unnamed protein product, partial [Rotaria sp. Silwood1]